MAGGKCVRQTAYALDKLVFAINGIGKNDIVEYAQTDGAAVHEINPPKLVSSVTYAFQRVLGGWGSHVDKRIGQRDCQWSNLGATYR